MHAGPARSRPRLIARRGSGFACASALLYSFDMPAQVIVVQRPRRNRFAVLRAVPAWLRSVRVALRRTLTRDAAIVQPNPIGSRSVGAPLFPRLCLDASGAHRCIGCELCVRICPSHCLTIATEGQGTGLRVTRFDLVRGACIGCGLCSEACPEGAIEMAPGVAAELAPLSDRPAITDLLTDRSTIPSSISSGRR